MPRALLHHRRFWLVLVGVFLCTPMFGQGTAKDLFTAKTVYLEVRSYRNSNVPPKDLEVVRRRAVSALEGFKRYTLVTDAKNADLVLEVAFASDYVYGMSRSQSAPTAFLRVQDRATGASLYCASDHSGFLTSATQNVFKGLRRKIEVHDPSPDRPSSLCGEESSSIVQ